MLDPPPSTFLSFCLHSAFFLLFQASCDHKELLLNVDVNVDDRIHPLPSILILCVCCDVSGCQAVIALSHDCSAHQNGLLKENVVPPLVRLLRGTRTKERTLLSVITALASLCIGMPSQHSVRKTKLGGQLSCLWHCVSMVKWKSFEL